MATKKKTNLEFFVPRPDAATSTGALETIRPKAPLDRGEAFAFGEKGGAVTGVATNLARPQGLLPQVGFQQEGAVPRPEAPSTSPSEMTLQPTPAPLGSPLHVGAGEAPVAPEVAVGGDREDADINPLGREMSKLEKFNRRKVARNPNAFSPAERQQVLGGIAKEQKQADREAATKAEAAAGALEFGREVALEGAKAGFKGEQTRETAQFEADIAATAKQAEEAFAKGEREAGETFKKKELAQRGTQAIAEIQEKARLDGVELTQKIASEGAATVQKIMAEAKVSELKARDTFKRAVYLQAVKEANAREAEMDAEELAASPNIVEEQFEVAQAALDKAFPETEVEQSTVATPQGVVQETTATTTDAASLDGQPGLSPEEQAYDEAMGLAEQETSPARKLRAKALAERLKKQILESVTNQA